MRMMTDVIFDEGCNEKVRMIIAGLQSQNQRNTLLLAGFLKVLRQELIMEELVILSLSAPTSMVRNLENHRQHASKKKSKSNPKQNSSKNTQ